MNDKDAEWLNELAYSQKGELLCTMANIAAIMRHDSRLANIVYNEMRNSIDVIGEVPWKRNPGCWSNMDFPCFQMYIENTYKLYAPRKCKDTIHALLSSEKRYHPVKAYLGSLSWDGSERLDRLLIDYLNAEDTDYVRAVTRKTFTTAVARIYNPGIKYDTMLVLCGNQGIGKSTLFAKLGRTWYSDSMTIADMKDKSAAEKLQGIWIMELSELAGIKKVDVETVKSFLSRTDDQYRAPYETYVEAHPRSSIVVGTTNTVDGFLQDITGNRRFWPVQVNGNCMEKAWELTDEDVDQLWAEAVAYYKNGETLYLNTDMEAAARMNQRQAMETDPRQGLVGEYLRTSGNPQICLMELWCECLGKERSDMKRRDAFELEGILRQLGGWEVYTGNTTGKKRLPGYGVQKTFVKTSEPAKEDKTHED